MRLHALTFGQENWSTLYQNFELPQMSFEYSGWASMHPKNGPLRHKVLEKAEPFAFESYVRPAIV